MIRALALGLVACQPAPDSGAPAAASTQEISPTLSAFESVPVFTGGDGVYHTYRIPSVIETEAGTLLAFAEGRVGSAADRRENDLVLRRSTDNGVTWDAMQVIQEQGVHSLNDPTAVQVESGPHAGRVYLMYRRVACRQSGIGSDCEPIGDLPYTLLVTWSDDEGETWSAPRDLADVIHHERDAVGPGNAIQTRHPPASGRLVFPVWGQGLNYAVFSDDGGDTWVAGEPSSIDATDTTGNEAQIVELSDGRLMMSARHRSDDGEFAEGYRKVAFSEDAGETWTDLADDPLLPDQQVMASILRFSNAEEHDRERLLFSNPTVVFRSEGTVRMSNDDAESWPVERVVEPGTFQYSAMVRLDCRHVGMLYEVGLVTEEIRFGRFSIDWLTEGADTPRCGGPE